MILRLKRKEAFFAFPEKGENFSVFLWVTPRGEAPFQVLRLGPPRSVPSILFWPVQVIQGLRLVKGPRVESSIPPHTWKAKKAGREASSKTGQELRPWSPIKKGAFLLFPSFPCLQAGKKGGALLPGKKGTGVGPAQAGKGWPPGRLQGGDPLERPWTLPSFLCQRKVPKAGFPGKP